MTAKIGGDDRRIFPHRRSVPLGQCHAVIEHVDAVRYFHHQAHIVFNKNDGDTRQDGTHATPRRNRAAADGDYLPAPETRR